jgi:hypothetical protein
MGKQTSSPFLRFPFRNWKHVGQNLAVVLHGEMVLLQYADHPTDSFTHFEDARPVHQNSNR